METLPVEEGSVEAAPARYLSPRRAAKQAERAEKASPLPTGSGRRNLRHTEPRPLPDFRDEKVTEKIVRFDIRRGGTKTTQLEAICLECGPLGSFPKRAGAINSIGVHVEEAHKGKGGYVRRDVV